MPSALTTHAVDQPGQPTRMEIIPGEYIVTLKPEFIGEPEAGDLKSSNASLEQQQQNIFIAAAGAEELIEDQGGNVTHIYDRVLNGFAVEGVQDVTPLIQDPAIESVEPNFRAFPETQYFPAALDRLDLDRAVTASSRPDNREDRPNIDVAIIDQPLPSQHPDLVIASRTNLIDGCGTKRVVGGASDGEILQCYTEQGLHGIHVAGSIAARDNLGGVVGGLPGARIHGLGICSVNGGCAHVDTLQSWEVIISRAQGGDQYEIANESVGSCGEGVSAATQTAGQNLINAGVTMFISAGNCNAESVNKAYCSVSAFICVSALADFDGKCGGQSSLTSTSLVGTNRDDQRAVFSNHGSDVDIMAPGVNVLSTAPGALSGVPDPELGWGTGSGKATYIGTSEQGRYAVLSGTSMASPIAAGIGALLKSKNPGWTPATVKTQLLAQAYPQNQACDGFGRGGLAQGANSESSEKMLYAGNY